MLEDGCIQMHRSILKWEWYDDINTCRVFTHLLLTASYYDNEWHGMKINRGQRVCSYAKLAKETSLSVQNVRTAIKHLISTGELTYLNNREYGLVTVNNYDKYQWSTQEPTNLQQTSNTPLTHLQQQSNKANKAIKQKDNYIQPDKTQFTDYVFMTHVEYDKLVDRVGEYGAKRCIEILDNYKGSSGKKYKDDYRAILNWVIDRYKQEPKPAPEPQEHAPPKPEDDIPFRKEIPDNATLSDILPPATEDYTW